MGDLINNHNEWLCAPYQVSNSEHDLLMMTKMGDNSMFIQVLDHPYSPSPLVEFDAPPMIPNFSQRFRRACSPFSKHP